VQQFSAATEQSGEVILIQYDAGELGETVSRALDSLESDMSSGSTADVLGGGILEVVRTRLREARSRASGQLRIVVLGEFKRGKSTLVNALLGAVVAPVDALPETITINEYSHAESFRAFLRLEDGGRLQLSQQDLASNRLADVLTRVNAGAKQVDVAGPFPRLNSVTLVDTPGTGDVAQHLEQHTLSYLQQADLVVVVVSVTSPLSQSEQSLLRAAVAPHEFSRICFVLNMADTLRDVTDIERVTQHLAGKVSALFPGANVYPVSALDEVQRITGGARPAPEAAPYLELAFARFRADLEELVTTRADAILLERSVHRSTLALREIEARVQLLEDPLTRKRDELQRMVEDHAVKMSTEDSALTERKLTHQRRLEALASETAAWMDGFLVRLQAKLSEQLKQLKQDDIEREFPFFLNDTLRTALEACLEAHAGELQKTINEALENDAAFSASASQGFTKEVALHTFSAPQGGTAAYLESLVESLLVPVFGLPLYAFAESTLADERNKKGGAHFAARFVESTPALRSSVAAIVRRTYADIAERLDAQVRSAHATKQAATQAALERARQLKQLTDAEAQNVSQRLGLILGTIRTTRGEIERVQQKLRSSSVVHPN